MGTCTNLCKSSNEKNIILTFENNSSSIKEQNSNKFKSQKIAESNYSSYKTNFSNSKNIIINKEVNNNIISNSKNETKKQYLSNNEEIIKSLEKIDYFLHNNVFDIDDDNESILFNDIVDLHSIGIKYQDNNNINDYKSETIYNKERSVTDNSKK